MDILTLPQLAVPTEDDAIATINKWLHSKVEMALHSTTAKFDPTTFYWHLPIELAYATHGTLGVVGDIYLHAATGAFAGHLETEEIIKRAEALATAYGIE